MALGNGGLGRLAACFLDSAATHDIPLDGYGLRYKFGLFRQTFENCRQMEAPDDWTKWGDAWSVRRDDLAVTVPMRTGEVVAVPYDMPVIGLGGHNIGTLRLWQAESEEEINFRLFNEQKYAQASAMKNRAEDITKVLYPNDTLRAGKQMRCLLYTSCSSRPITTTAATLPAQRYSCPTPPTAPTRLRRRWRALRWCPCPRRPTAAWTWRRCARSPARTRQG